MQCNKLVNVTKNIPILLKTADSRFKFKINWNKNIFNAHLSVKTPWMYCCMCAYRYGDVELYPQVRLLLYRIKSKIAIQCALYRQKLLISLFRIVVLFEDIAVIWWCGCFLKLHGYSVCFSFLPLSECSVPQMPWHLPIMGHIMLVHQPLHLYTRTHL